jgi:hypothetical protein
MEGFFVLFWCCWNLNSGFHACYASILPLEPKVLLFDWAGLDLNPLIYAFHVAEMTDMHHHTQF